MKNTPQNTFWIIIIILLAILIQITVSDKTKVTAVFPVDGKLDLGWWDGCAILELDGQWRYLENGLIKDIDKATDIHYVKVPHLFNRKPEMGGNPYGVATYGLTLSGLKPDAFYMIQIMNEVSAYRVTMNGEEVLSAGTVAATAQQHRPEMKEKSSPFKSDSRGNVEIWIEVSNFSYNYGGLWKAPMIGLENVMSSHISHQKGIEIFLFSSILIMGMFFLALYGVNSEFKPLFYFSLICILIAIRTMLVSNKQFYDFIHPVSWDTGTRMEFLIGYLMLPVFGLFFNSLEFIKKSKIVEWICYLMILISFILMVFTPNEVYANLLDIYLKLIVASLLYVGFVIFQGVRRRKPGSLIVLIGMLGFVPAILTDIYSDPVYAMLPFGTYFMLIMFSVMVIKNSLNLKQQHDYLEMAVLKDPLTGLKNRYCLNRLMGTGYEFPQGMRMYILFFDLDKFKSINDTYGHDVGDAILRESAGRIQSCFHRESDIVFRYGGDEFLAFAVVKDEDGIIELIINRILEKFKEPILYNQHEFVVGVSIGVSRFQSGGNIEKAIKESDNAMYHAKKSADTGIMIIDGLVVSGSK